jgi:uncharacterized protein (TIGR02231 family)
MMLIKTKATTLSGSLLLLAFAVPSFGAAVESRITAVTVYGDRAIVTRTTSNEFTAGEHTLVFENLPAALLDPSLQASGRGVAGATILDVSAQTIFVEATANERVKSVEDQIKSLQKQRRVLDDRAKILEEQQGFVQRMLQASTAPLGGAGAAVAARPALDDWKSLFLYSDEALGKIATERQSIDTQREDLQAKEAALGRQLNDLRGARGRQSKTITVRVALTTPGKLEIAVRYAIPNASWTPAYDARLRSADRSVELSYFGNVRNGTGEDWKDVVLTLSTARPSIGGGAPELRPWVTDILRPRPSVASGLPMVGNDVLSLSTTINPDLVGERRQIFSPVDAELGRGNSQVEVTTKRRSAAPPPPPPQADSTAAALTATVESTITSATFKIPIPVSIPGNNISQKVAIKDTRLGATLQFQSTPKLIEAAFLSANTNNETEYPLLAGPMNTFFDDTFVATSALKTVMPGEKFDVALGVDDSINVKRRIVNRFTEDTGLTNKSRRVTYEILVTVTNNKTTPERITFKEPTPLSRDEKVVVKILTPQEKEIGSMTAPKEVTREEDGKLVWRVNLKPGEKREFSLKLSVEHPGDVTVTGLE